MPPDNRSLETRLTEVEEELRRLKHALADKDDVVSGLPWWKQIIGSHENDPVFAEIVKLGRQIREQDQSLPAKNKGRTAKSARPRKIAGKE